MKIVKPICILIASLWAYGCSENEGASRDSQLNQGQIQQFAQQLDIKYQVITNRTDEHCDKTQTQGLCFQAQITLTSAEEISASGWEIYFSNVAPIQMDESDLFDITHINGDLHKIVPNQQLAKMEANKPYNIKFRAGFWHLSQTDMMPNYYVVAPNLTPVVIASTVPEINEETLLEMPHHAVAPSLQDKHFKRTEQDKTEPATATWLYEQNESHYVDVDVTAKILPTPLFSEVQGEGLVDLSQGVNYRFGAFNVSRLKAALTRLSMLGVKTMQNGVPITFSKDPSLAQEAYAMTIGKERIAISASTDTGAFYALQSIASLITPGQLDLPLLKVKDQPRFPFRGMHVDVSRNFKSKEFIKQVLEQMAAYKLNKFHFHLADDEGWRVEIPGLPELTRVGAYRCHDLTEQSCLLPQLGAGPHRDTEVNGYYSVADYIEILEFAKARHIQVIPSMDMPGHSRAAIKSMAARQQRLLAEGKPDEANRYLLHDIEDTTKYSSIQFYNDNTINACMDSSYRFIHKVVDELNIMHQKANNALTRYHIGADETAGAWINSPSCKSLLSDNVAGIDDAEGIAAYFVEKVSRILADKGIEAAGWNDGMGHTKKERMPKVVQSNAWSPLMWSGHAPAHEQANRGWEVVVSSPDAVYFDFPYEADPLERGYYWAARRINTKKVFEFMPENLAANAEVWKDRQEMPYEANDTESKLNQGVKFHGLQGQLWTETVRTDRQASYMIFPRLFALAERAWHTADWEVPYQYEGAVYNQASGFFTPEMREKQNQDWHVFANLVAKKVLPKLDMDNVFYRIPTAGAKLIDGKLHMNSIYPSLPLEFRVDGQEWQRYQQPVSIEGERVEARVGAALNDRKGRSLSL